jgi:hypothetical protein
LYSCREKVHCLTVDRDFLTFPEGKFNFKEEVSNVSLLV